MRFQAIRISSLSIIACLLIFLFSTACNKEKLIGDNPIIGDWQIENIAVGLYDQSDNDLEILEELPVEEVGGMQFKSNYRGSFTGESMPNWMPEKFNWNTRADTLIMEIYGYEIKPLFKLQNLNDNDYLDLLFSTDSLSQIVDQDTVLQLRMQRF